MQGPLTSALLTLFLSSVLAGTAAAQERWKATLEPYVWVPALEGEGSAEGSPEVDFEIDYPGELDAALPVALTLESPGGSVWTLDVLYARWRDDDGATRTETSVGLLEAGRLWPLGNTWSLAAGLRGIELDLDVETLGLERSARAAWIDPWIGGRAELPLSPSWSLTGRGDLGGFGLGSDLTWQAAAFLAWSAPSWRLEFGYRALAVDFDDDDLDTSLLAHGPELGLAFHL